MEAAGRAEIREPLSIGGGRSGGGPGGAVGGAAAAGPDGPSAGPDGRRHGGGRRRWSPCGGPPEVRLILLQQYFNTTGTEIALGALFDAYLLIRLGSNKFVGTVESARGIAALLMALPLGWAGDVFPKSTVLRVNVMLGIAAAVLLAFGLPSDAMGLIVAGCVAMSIHNQCLFGLMPVLLREFTSEGNENAAAQSNRQTAESLGRASGPALQLLLIGLSGSDHWSEEQLHWLLLAGLVFFLLYVPAVCRVQLLHSRHCQARSAAVAGQASDPSAHPPEGPKWNWLIASLCEASSFVTAIGSGMTFKYWPLFFKQDFGFSPAGVCLMNLSIWLAIAVCNQLVQPVQRRCGRLPVANALHIMGTLLLFVISNQSLGASIEVPLVILRNAIMNSGGPIVQSLILELVPPQHRGKWSSLASLRRMSWSGSAFIGGFLSDSHDYRYAFFITACVHTAAGAMLLLVNVLMCLRPAEPLRAAAPCDAEAAPASRSAAGAEAGELRGGGGGHASKGATRAA